MQNYAKPASEEELDSMLDAAYALARDGDYTQALALCEWLMQDDMAAIPGHRQRAAILAHQGNIQAAISDLEHVVRAVPYEPADFHALGILQLQCGETSAAGESFRKAVLADAAASSNYYTNSSLLLSAEAQLRLANYAAALANAGPLPDGYKVYIPGTGMRTKEDVIGEASNALARKEKNRFKFER